MSPNKLSSLTCQSSQWVGNISKVWYESSEKFTKPGKDRTSLLQEGVGQFCTALVFSEEGATPTEDYSKPKCTALVLPKKHFDPRSVKPAACSFSNTR